MTSRFPWPGGALTTYLSKFSPQIFSRPEDALALSAPPPFATPKLPGGKTPTTPTPVHLRPSWCPSASFRLATALTPWLRICVTVGYC